MEDEEHHGGGAVGGAAQPPRGGGALTKQQLKDFADLNCGAAGGAGSRGAFGRGGGGATPAGGESNFGRRPPETRFLTARQPRGVAALAAPPDGVSDCESIASNAATCGGESPDARARNERLVRNITEELRQSSLVNPSLGGGQQV